MNFISIREVKNFNFLKHKYPNTFEFFNMVVKAIGANSVLQAEFHETILLPEIYYHVYDADTEGIMRLMVNFSNVEFVEISFNKNDVHSFICVIKNDYCYAKEYFSLDLSKKRSDMINEVLKYFTQLKLGGK